MRVLCWFLPLWVLVRWTRRYGELILQDTALPDGRGWSCFVRWTGPGPRYSWRGTGRTLRAAIARTLLEARQAPIKEIKGKPFAPVLGDKEFDTE